MAGAIAWHSRASVSAIGSPPTQDEEAVSVPSAKDPFSAASSLRAIELLSKAGLPVLPRNYELFYCYATGQNEGLEADLERLLDSRAQITQSELDRLHDRYMAAGDDAAEFASLCLRLNKQIGDAIELVERAVDSTSTYGTSLDKTGASLIDLNDPRKVSIVVSTLVQATKQMGRSSIELNDRFRQTSDEVDALKKDLEAVRKQSVTDPLTGISNRAVFDRMISIEVERAHRQGQALCLCMVDIDHFKRYNDTYGHRAGDSVLRLVAKTMTNSVRRYDVVARYGGEEFGIILPNTSVHIATAVIERIRQILQERELIKRSTGESMGRVTISAGIAMLKPNEVSESLVERADSHLLEAKKAGRNRINTDQQPDHAKVPAQEQCA